MNGNIYLSLRQLSVKLGGLSRSSIYRAVAAGELPAPRKIGARSVWSEREVDEALDA